MEMEKSKVLIQFLLIFRQSGDVLFFLYARRLRGYTETDVHDKIFKLGSLLIFARRFSNSHSSSVLQHRCFVHTAFKILCCQFTE